MRNLKEDRHGAPSDNRGDQPVLHRRSCRRSLDVYALLGFEPRFREPKDEPFFAIVGRGGAQIFLKHVGAEA